MPKREKEKDFEVLKTNWAAVELFLKCQTQYRIGGLGQVTGFDYASVIAIAKLYSVDDLHYVIEDLQVMEIRAIELFNKEKK